MKINHIFATIILASTLTACSEGTKVTYSTAPVEKQNISTSITATGTIEPVTEVEVGTQVGWCGTIDDWNIVAWYAEADP